LTVPRPPGVRMTVALAVRGERGSQLLGGRRGVLRRHPGGARRSRQARVATTAPAVSSTGPGRVALAVRGERGSQHDRRRRQAPGRRVALAVGGERGSQPP
jgi:hypothetical protein